jgi:septal ring factor EnvC (AmiA/AmiB activator)
MEGKTAPMTLQERIAVLENTIRDYETLLKTVVADGKDNLAVKLLETIDKARDSLHDLNEQQREERQLLAQQQQPNRGNF